MNRLGRPITLSAEQARAHLLRTSHLPPATPARSVEDLAANLVGLHATGTTGPYVQAFARMARFAKEDLDRSLYATRSLLRVRCMRGTVFILPRDLAAVAVAATRAQVQPASHRFMAFLGTNALEYERLATRIEALLADGVPSMTAAQLRARLGASNGISGVVNLMCDEGRLYRDRPIGTWRSRTFTYRLPGDLEAALRPSMEADSARLALVRQYIERYGPVTTHDVAWWSGLSMRVVRDCIARLRPGVETVSVEELTEPALMARDHLDGAVASGGTVPGMDRPAVSLLPELDPYLMGRHDRTTMVPPATRGFVFDRAGNATSVILVDGVVRGIWQCAAAGAGDDGSRELLPRLHPAETGRNRIHADVPRVLVHYLDDVGSEAREETCRQATATGRFSFGADVDVREVPTMRPLAAGGSATFLAPLGQG